VAVAIASRLLWHSSSCNVDVAAAMLLPYCNTHCCDIADWHRRKHSKGFVLLFQLLSPFHLIRFLSVFFGLFLSSVAVVLLISQSNKPLLFAIQQQDVYCYGRATHSNFFFHPDSPPFFFV